MLRLLGNDIAYPWQRISFHEEKYFQSWRKIFFVVKRNISYHENNSERSLVSWMASESYTLLQAVWTIREGRHREETEVEMKSFDDINE